MIPSSRSHTVLWHRLDQPGHESARLAGGESRWHLDGAAVFLHEKRPCRLDYRLVCDSGWRTLSGEVSGWVGSERIAVEVLSDSAGGWRLNGETVAEVEGCQDLDLNFSPSTNLLPIRRLNLAVGQEARVRAAWLRFPSFRLQPLEQVYRRTGERTYRYESSGGSFTADLRVDAAGFVLDYAGIWRAEAGSEGAPEAASPSSRTAVLATTPLFVVTDLQRSIDFYCGKLGFQEPAIWGDPPCFAMMHRDLFDLMLSLAENPRQVTPNGPDTVWDFYIKVKDLDAEVAALGNAGVPLDRAPRETEYGMREIEILDPDGYRICLGQDLG